jgi:hypothetical protein
MGHYRYYAQLFFRIGAFGVSVLIVLRQAGDGAIFIFMQAEGGACQ